jgi:hypothetical protein
LEVTFRPLRSVSFFRAKVRRNGLGELRRYLAPFYGHTDLPPVDPELMIRTLIVGYCFATRSERRLCEEVHVNPAYKRREGSLNGSLAPRRSGAPK